MMLAAASLLTYASVGTASAATGDGPQARNPGACPRGYVCVWNDNSFTGKPKWKSKGDLPDRVYAGAGASVFNNGVRHQGGDHIRFKYRYNRGTWESECLHYPGDSPSQWRSYPDGVFVKDVKWGDEC